MKKFVVLLVVLTVVLGTVLGIRLRQQAREAEAAPGSSGIVEGTRVTVASRLASRVAKVHVGEGDAVEPGMLLAELDCAEPDALVAEAEARVEAARAQIEGAKAQAAAATAQARAADGQVRSQRAGLGSVKVQGENARRQEARAKRLEGEGAAAAQARENAETAATDLAARLVAGTAAARAAEDAARAAARQADAVAEQVHAAERLLAAAEAGLARAKVARDECRVVSPVKGVVTLQAREAGEVVLPGSVVFELTDWSETRVTFYVANRDLGKVAVGATVAVTADPYPGESFRGQVRRVSDEAEFTPRTIQTRSDRDRLVYEVEARVDNPGLKLRAGMPVEVEVAQP